MENIILLSRYFLTPFDKYNEIVPGIWLGNLQACYDNNFLENQNIVAIVSLYTPILNAKKLTNKGIAIFHLKISDNIGLKTNLILLDNFENIYNFISKYKKKRKYFNSLSLWVATISISLYRLFNERI